jgi:hypothetical protein
VAAHPIGHHTAGWWIVSDRLRGEENDTVCVAPGATVTDRRTRIAWPPGEATVADSRPVCAVAAWLVTSAFTVSDEVERSAALSWTTWELLSASGPEL